MEWNVDEGTAQELFEDIYQGVLGIYVDGAYWELEQKKPEASLREKVENVLPMLPPREGSVLRLRYGLDDVGQLRSPGEVSTILGLPEKRVVWLEKWAFKRLRRYDPSLADPADMLMGSSCCTVWTDESEQHQPS